MHIDDLFITITRQLLKMDDQVFADTKKDLMNLFQNYEFSQPQKVNAFSIGGTNIRKNLLGYWNWLQELRSEGFVSSSVEDIVEPQNLPSYINSAFANSALKILSVCSKEKVRSYFPMMRYSRQTWIDGKELATLIDAQFSDQEKRNQLWQKVLTSDVNRFGSYMEAKTLEDARNFLRIDYETYFCPANDILRTVQHFCAKSGSNFIIPKDLSSKLEKRPVGSSSFENHYEPYPHEALTGAEIVELIDAQKKEQIWSNIYQAIIWMKDEPNAYFKQLKENMTGSELRQFFKELTSEQIMYLPVGNITAALGQNFLIPENLKSKFTFPEKPPIPDDDLWLAKNNTASWQMICFEFGGEDRLSEKTKSVSVNLPEVLGSFVSTLTVAEAFSKKVDSSFTDAFSLSLWVLKSKDLNLYDSVAYLNAAKQSGFSDRTLSILDRKMNSNLYKVLRLTEDHARASLALDLANVFGGMGSWNDQGFSDPNDQAQYKAVSAALYDAIKNMQHALNAS